jgi:ribosomal protein L24
MKKRPLFLPFTILITTILLGISVPAIMLANRSNESGFSHPATTPTPAVTAFARDGQYRDIVEQNQKNCTYHGYHWETVPDAWPSQITLGGITYTRADMLKLRNAPEGDPAIDLIKEVHIAIVNIYNGASQSRVEATLVEADRWLTSHQADGELSQFNQQQARSFTSVLADYNHGRLFPVACADQIPAPTVEVALLENTLPAASTSTEPSVVADQPAAARNIQSSTTVNTEAPPSLPTPLPTDTPVPTPTETLAPPPTKLRFHPHTIHCRRLPTLPYHRRLSQLFQRRRWIHPLLILQVILIKTTEIKATRIRIRAKARATRIRIRTTRARATRIRIRTTRARATRIRTRTTRARATRIRTRTTRARATRIRTRTTRARATRIRTRTTRARAKDKGNQDKDKGNQGGNKRP